MENWIRSLSETPAVQRLRQRVEAEGVLSLAGISRSAQPFLAVLLRQILPERPIIVVAEGVKTQESFQQDIETWLALSTSKPPRPEGDSPQSQTASRTHEKPLFFPAWEVLPHESKLPHADVVSERLETLVGLNQGAPIVVTTAVALMQRTFKAEAMRSRTRMLRRGDQVEPLDLIEWLEDQGYEPEAKVTQKGEIALRGGIVDVFPLTSPWPVRLEFFGDELDSLRYFDPVSQISREPIDSVVLPPGGEIGLLKREVEKHQSTPGDGAFPLASLLDYLPDSAVFLLCEPEQLDEHAAQYGQQVPKDDPFILTWDTVLAALDERDFSRIELREGETLETDSDEADGVFTEAAFNELDPSLALKFSSLDAYRPLGERSPDPQIAETQRREFFMQIHRWLRQHYTVHVICNNDGERQRFHEIWQEYGFDQAGTTEKEGSRKKTPQARLVGELGALARGFLFEPAKWVVVTDAEIFGRYKVQRPRRLKSPHAVAARSALDIDFTELEEGDFVVHLQHGIGRYLGLQMMPAGLGRRHKAGGSEKTESEDGGQECLVIEYAPSDPDQPAPKLYVPVTQAHLVSKYVGTGKARPALHTLGGTKWIKAKVQAEQAVRDLAGELLAIQAARESLQGHAAKSDTPWQREFEGAFLYEETPDQMRAINESKRDMESTKPMDRLICGDVGYGKTEVAIRTAFKAVMDGRQVAILVPTTILAQQHFNTFRERMADYPIKIEQLSRFRTKREQKRIVEQLAEGAIDIVVGTHRLLQDDVAFKELGLVVIDEEQRFGVMHKEKFKLLRRLVDVLTLSATPIPRTLYLALTGARDMSTIETPPQDRLPVETVVTQYDERVIRDAIQRELNREGQVYFLHNRVDDIQNVALKIKTLVPSARIVVGHGQMDEHELEEVMAAFINGKADVLVSTTIIESGIDIPNANTIIIDRADRFGLSDLYQLRGRVGRYKHQAYAYLLLPRHAALLSDVRKRISAIKQYSSLGSGFKIAMRDLEIRGAGNLLGPEQSGHITAVGFDLYCQLLKQSVSALKGEKVKPRVEVDIRLDFLALNPGEERRPDQDESIFGGAGSRSRAGKAEVSVPRQVATYAAWEDEVAETKPSRIATPVPRVPAYIPFDYIRESQQRIEVYRKLAQIADKESHDRLRVELRDRFGKIPPAVEYLLQVSELKYLASERSVTSIETKEDKLMLQRNKDFIMVGGKFPRLVKKDAKARLNEIKRLLLAL